MRNQNFIFVTFCLILVMGLLQVRFVLEKTYGDERLLKHQLQQSEAQVEKQKMKTIVFQNQLLDMQVQLASLHLSPQTPEGEWVRSLRLPASVKNVELSTLFFEEAAKSFQEANYSNSSKILREMLEKYPSSPKAIDARFLLAESYFRSQRFSECLDLIDEMITQFPDNKLTGYLMLRMGQIFQSKNQTEKTREVFRMVIRNFSSERALVGQAEQLLKAAEK